MRKSSDIYSDHAEDNLENQLHLADFYISVVDNDAFQGP